MWWLLGIAILSIVLLLLLVMPVRTDFVYHCHGTNGAFHAKFSACGGLLKFTVAERAPDRKAKRYWPTVMEWVDRIRNAFPMFRYATNYILSKTTVRQLSCQTKFGTGDAALTGVLTGLVWALLTNFLSWFTHQVKQTTSSPQVSVDPVFADSTFAIEFRCIFEVRLGHIIIAGVTAMRRIRQRRG